MRSIGTGGLILVLSAMATGWPASTPDAQPQARAAPRTAPPAEPTPPNGRADAGIEPFSAHYTAEWRNISVAVSDLKLERDGRPGHYHYKWTISARGIFRLAYSDDVIQQSWFGVIDGQARPEKYRANQGSSTVGFDFDWASGHARGSSEGKPVDIELKPGTQDLMSIQVEVMLALRNGNLPPVFHIIDKDQLKDFVYTREGTARLSTPLGSLDTIIVASRRNANDSRVLRMWFAPPLGFVPVQAERTRDGKLEFAMRIKSLSRPPEPAPGEKGIVLDE
jgi:uncharacterized protein DUF3108